MAIDTNIALISLADAKEHLKVTGIVEDTVIGNFVNMVSAMCNTYVGRILLNAPHTEYYNGNGDTNLLLKHTPITLLTNIWNAGEDRVFDDNAKMNKATELLVNEQSGIIEIWQGQGRFNKFLNGKANIKVIYTGGYTLAVMPYDIQLAVRMWLGAIYMKYYNRRYEYISANTVNNSTTFLERDMPADVKMILNNYKDQFGYPQFAYKE